MNGQFLKIIQYGIFLLIAFSVPKWITESGHYLHRFNKKSESASAVREPSDLLYQPPHLSQEKFSTSGPSISQQSKSPPDTETAQRYTSFYPEGSNATAPSSPSDLARNPSDSWSNIDWLAEVTPLEEILRFDRTPDWILFRWPKVGTVQSESPLKGYRVAVVTGTEKNDLAGVLTYYFDQRQLQRLDFSGQTGDYTKILFFLQKRFGMTVQTESTAEKFLYQSTLNQEPGTNKPPSTLTIKPATSFSAQRPHEFYQVDFCLH